MKDKRVLIVHIIHHLVIGGMENGVVNLINRLPKDRFRHAVLCVEDFSDFRQRIQDPEVEVIALHRSRIGAWRLRWQILLHFLRLRPDIVHTRNLSGLDALLPARLVGCRTVHSEHGFDVNNLQGQASKPALLRRLHAPLVQRYVCVSLDLRQLMIESWRLPGRRISHIYNGVDTERFCPPASRREDVLPPGFLPEGGFLVGTVGRAQAVKDQATLLRSFAQLLKRRPSLASRVRLAVVGHGPLYESLRALAAELEVSSYTWFAGARHDIADVLQSFDLFVLPSLNEGISNTLLEAMATGLPVLATAVGGNLELVDEGVVGASFNAGDVRTLAAMIENYATDASLCARHGAAARERVEQNFSLQAMLAGYDKIYQGLKSCAE